MRGRQLEDFVDTGGDRVGEHVEVSELHPAGRQFDRGVLLGRAHEPPAAGRHRNQDDPHRQEHSQPDHLEGHLGGLSNNSYRGLVKILPKAENARNYSQCDSLLIGGRSGANTFPYIEVGNNSAKIEHEASTSKISEEQIFYFNQRGVSTEDAVSMIIN